MREMEQPFHLKLNDPVNIKMKQIPTRERPYEKFAESGAEALSDTELLSILIKNGKRGASAMTLATQIMALDQRKEGLRFLCNIPTEDLMSVEGIGHIKAAVIKSAIELGRRATRNPICLGETKIGSPKDASLYLKEEMQTLEREEIRIILLDSKNTVLRVVRGSMGSVTQTMVSPKDIFKDAIKYNASSIILVHNHPSGDPKPSKTDIRTTAELMRLGRELDIQLLDHIVLAKNGYESIKSALIRLGEDTDLNDHVDAAL